MSTPSKASLSRKGRLYWLHYRCGYRSHWTLFGKGHWTDLFSGIKLEVLPLGGRVGARAIPRGEASCLTKSYSELWDRHAASMSPCLWSSNETRLGAELDHLSAKRSPWSTSSALRSDFARRLALVEIDVLVAQALGPYARTAHRDVSYPVPRPRTRTSAAPGTT